MDAAFDRANLESLSHASAVLLGRTSFDMFSGYWPFIADAPAVADPDSPEGRQFDDVNRAISRRYTAVPKVVVSDSGSIDEANAWAGSTTVVPRDGIAAWIEAAKRESEGAADGIRPGDLVVFGSGRTWNALLRQGLVDELHLMLSPNALGAGVPLFESPAPLELLEARTFDDSDNVQLRYRVIR